MLELNVTGMSCQHCVATVTHAVEAVAPKARVTVDLTTQIVRIEGDASREAVVAAIDDAGYDVANA